MAIELKVRSWAKASEADIRSGLLGWISLEYGPWVFDGITLRRSADGRFILSFPARTDRAGRRHSYLRPADDDARQQVQREILRQLGQRDDVREGALDG